MRSTLVSFSPRDIFETIPGLACAFYRLPGSVDKKPSILYVDDSYYYKPDMEGNQDRVYVPAAQIADSVAHMHVTSQLGYTANTHPAVFAIRDEEIDENALMGKFKKEVNQALDRQKNWFLHLVKLADDDWQIAQRHNMISDIQRTAVRELGLERPYLMKVEFEDIKNCPFCSSNLINENAPVCPNCMRVLNPAKLAELEAKLGITGKTKALTNA